MPETRAIFASWPPGCAGTGAQAIRSKGLVPICRNPLRRIAIDSRVRSYNIFDDSVTSPFMFEFATDV